MLKVGIDEASMPYRSVYTCNDLYNLPDARRESPGETDSPPAYRT